MRSGGQAAKPAGAAGAVGAAKAAGADKPVGAAGGDDFAAPADMSGIFGVSRVPESRDASKRPRSADLGRVDLLNGANKLGFTNNKAAVSQGAQGLRDAQAGQDGKGGKWSQSEITVQADNAVRPLRLNTNGPLVRVGAIPWQIAVDRAEWVVSRLRRAGLPFHLTQVPVSGFDRHSIINKEDYYASPAQVEKVFDALLNRQIEIGVIALPELPQKLPAGIRVAAISEVVAAEYALVSLSDHPAGEHDFIGVYSFSLARQLRSEKLGAHYEQRPYNFEQALTCLHEGVWGACAIPLADLIFDGCSSEYSVEVLSKQRVVPPAGQGAVAVLVSDCEDELAAAVFSFLHNVETEKIYRLEIEIANLVSDRKERAGSCIWSENNTYFMSLYNPRLERPFQRWLCKPISEPGKRINKQLCYSILHGVTGNVHLIGIGSGAPKQLTIEAEYLLRRTDLVICRSPQAEQLFYLLPVKASILDIDSDARLEQMDFLLEQIIDAWRKGLKIAVLIRGDGYLLSCGGVLAKSLIERRVPFQLTPGISISISGPSLAGVPLIFPGRSPHAHLYDGSDPMLSTYRFDMTAGRQGTLLFYIVPSQGRYIASLLMRQGFSAHTAVMFLARPGHPEQGCVVSTLAMLEHALSVPANEQPGLLIVGEIVRSHEVMDRTDSGYKPLLGKSVLIPSIDNSDEREFAWQREWEEQGAHIIKLRLSAVLVDEDNKAVLRDLFDQILRGDLCLPSVIKVPATKHKERLFERDRHKNEPEQLNITPVWLAFLSSDAVTTFFDEYLASGHDMRQLSGCAFAAPNDEVYRTLSEVGIQADYTAPGQTAEDLAGDMQRFLTSQDQILVFRGAEDSEMMEIMLNMAKFRVRGVAIYHRQNSLPPADRLLRLFDEAEYIAFATVAVVNPFAYAMAAAKLGHDALRNRPIRLLAADADVQEALLDRGFQVHGSFGYLADL